MAKLWLTGGTIFGDTPRWWTSQIAIRVKQMRSISHDWQFNPNAIGVGAHADGVAVKHPIHDVGWGSTRGPTIRGRLDMIWVKGGLGFSNSGAGIGRFAERR